MRSLRVLVADDNEDHLFLTVRAFRDVVDVKIEVDGVRDGQEALDYIYRRGPFADRRRPHMIVLDLKMPRVNGLEVLERLQSDPELSSIPIVVLTSSDHPEDVAATYSLGGNSYVRKPVAMASVREHLGGMGSYWTATAELPEPPP
jgi:CheY-like chemotaxis protein